MRAGTTLLTLPGHSVMPASVQRWISWNGDWVHSLPMRQDLQTLLSLSGAVKQNPERLPLRTCRAVSRRSWILQQLLKRCQPVVLADELARKQRSISVAEFFEKNKH